MDYGRGGDALLNPHADYFVLRTTYVGPTR